MKCTSARNSEQKFCVKCDRTKGNEIVKYVIKKATFVSDRNYIRVKQEESKEFETKAGLFVLSFIHL